ncbi:hypothetical protein Patl1_07296 [Pistacia atlantica]|uniref:Uncharacterized protein n=1 Tax=Pistacia atlantica TaxID=434234 RepID=A0ACC1AKQ1_9ROSI|nr:hypothetical protein Patl1_07296 [Pistacia atlantica]
MVRLGSTH